MLLLGAEHDGLEKGDVNCPAGAGSGVAVQFLPLTAAEEGAPIRSVICCQAFFCGTRVTVKPALILCLLPQ